MRRFTRVSATDGRVVGAELDLTGTRMSVVQTMPDGSTKRSEKDYGSEAAAQSAAEQLARELIKRGYIEQAARGPGPNSPRTAASKPAGQAREHEDVDPRPAFEEVEAPAGTAAPVMPPLASALATKLSDTDAPEKKKKKGRGRKKKKKAQSGDALDRRVLAGIAGLAVGFLALIGFIIYDAFIKPPTIVGTWRGGMVDHEISRHLTITQYDLILDDKKQAELTLQNDETWVGTYAVKGNRLKLALKDGDGEPSEFEFKIAPGRATLELFEPESGKLLVQLIRQREPPVVRAKAPPRRHANLIGLPGG